MGDVRATLRDVYETRTINPRATRVYFQPMLSAESQSAGGGRHEWLGKRSIATKAETTAPREKNTDNAVTRYSLPRGMCSNRSVPSVGMEPYRTQRSIMGSAQLPHSQNEGCRGALSKIRTPTELPRKKRDMHNNTNVFAKDAMMPKIAVKKSVALKAVLRPMRSEPAEGKKTLNRCSIRPTRKFQLTCAPANCAEHHAREH